MRKNFIIRFCEAKASHWYERWYAAPFMSLRERTAYGRLRFWQDARHALADLIGEGPLLYKETNSYL